MAPLVYLLCAATAAACAALLLRAHARSGTRLLLWSGLCFALLTINNALLTIDFLVLPDVDLFAVRNLTALLGLLLLLYGLIWGFAMSGIDAFNSTMLGAIAMASFVAGTFFLRFWRQGRDRFFLLFALSFFVEGANRVAQALSASPSEGDITRYGVRFLAFSLILAAILDKNRNR